MIVTKYGFVFHQTKLCSFCFHLHVLQPEYVFCFDKGDEDKVVGVYDVHCTTRMNFFSTFAHGAVFLRLSFFVFYVFNKLTNI
jgi:hypothetical protein